MSRPAALIWRSKVFKDGDVWRVKMNRRYQNQSRGQLPYAFATLEYAVKHAQEWARKANG